MNERNSRKADESEKFEGFDASPRTWDFPTVIDEWVALLSGSEFKCLWYILRHTYGWQKSIDSISLSQFERGIYVKSKSRWLDRGTGLTRETITIALKKLREKGFIKKVKGASIEGDMEINKYEVVKKTDETSSFARELVPSEMKEDRGVVGKSDHPSRKNRLPVVGKSDPQSLTNTIPSVTKKDNDAKASFKSNGFCAREKGGAAMSCPGDEKMSEEQEWALERVVEFTGAKDSVAFYKKAIAELGCHGVEEELGEARYRNNIGQVRNKAKYLGALLTKQLKNLEEARSAVEDLPLMRTGGGL